MSSWRVTILGLAVIGSIGCSTPKPLLPPKIDTGAEQVAKTFFDALRREDWDAAYGTLDPASQASADKAKFAALGKDQLRIIGFNPTSLDVTVYESGDAATAVATFHGSTGTAKQFKDGTALKKEGAGWTVILRSNFGKKTTPPK